MSLQPEGLVLAYFGTEFGMVPYKSDSRTEMIDFSNRKSNNLQDQNMSTTVFNRDPPASYYANQHLKTDAAVKRVLYLPKNLFRRIAAR